LTPPTTRVTRRDTHRLIPSRFPPAGILDTVASPKDLAAVIELEGWTNDRLSSELGIILTIPKDEWVMGSPGANAVMAAYCHPHPNGGRFNDGTRGAWYAALELETAIKESAYRRTQELLEIGALDQRVEMRQYLADIDADFHDVRERPKYDPLYHETSYAAGQQLAAELLAAGSNGVLYSSVRRPPHKCIACFRPRLVARVRPAAHFEYVWSGTPEPAIRELRAA
jgi:hypothetical protein